MTDPLIDAAGFTRADLDENARGRISATQRAAIGGRVLAGMGGAFVFVLPCRVVVAAETL